MPTRRAKLSGTQYFNNSHRSLVLKVNTPPTDYIKNPETIVKRHTKLSEWYVYLINYDSNFIEITIYKICIKTIF